jgi:hypothetical protein
MFSANSVAGSAQEFRRRDRHGHRKKWDACRQASRTFAQREDKLPVERGKTGQSSDEG